MLLFAQQESKNHLDNKTKLERGTVLQKGFFRNNFYEK